MNLLAIAALIPSIVLHELGHGYMALRAGDDTAKRMGRLSFNPLTHIDPLGSIIIPRHANFVGCWIYFWLRQTRAH
jgi:Zn-dependent protease